MTDPPRPAPRRTIAIVGLVTLLLAAWGAAQWSLIPVSLHTTVERIDYQSESGYRWRILRLADGRDLVVDRRITDGFDRWPERRDLPIDKRAGARTVTIGGRTVDLRLSGEFWRVVASIGALVGLAIGRATLSSEPGRA